MLHSGVRRDAISVFMGTELKSSCLNVCVKNKKRRYSVV